MKAREHTIPNQKVKDYLAGISTSYTLRVVAYTYFVELITERADTVDFMKEVIKNIVTIEPSAVVWKLQVFKKVEESFTKRARLTTVADTYGRIYTTTVADGDAYIRMKQIDASYLDFAGNYSGDVDPTPIEFVQDDSGSFQYFKVKAGAQYIGLEVIGQTHQIESPVEAVKGTNYFTVKVKPTAAPSLAI